MNEESKLYATLSDIAYSDRNRYKERYASDKTDYRLGQDLTTENHSVLEQKDSGDIVIAFRGTKGGHELCTSLALLDF